MIVLTKVRQVDVKNAGDGPIEALAFFDLANKNSHVALIGALGPFVRPVPEDVFCLTHNMLPGSYLH